jgi:hypothetical protein
MDRRSNLRRSQPARSISTSGRAASAPNLDQPGEAVASARPQRRHSMRTGSKGNAPIVWEPMRFHWRAISRAVCRPLPSRRGTRGARAGGKDVRLACGRRPAARPASRCANSPRVATRYRYTVAIRSDQHAASVFSGQSSAISCHSRIEIDAPGHGGGGRRASHDPALVKNSPFLFFRLDDG